MELDQRHYNTIMTDVIPDEYARHSLPGHKAIVTQGKFGLLISQILERPDHHLCVNYFTFHYNMDLFIKPAATCTSLYYAMENSCTLIPNTRDAVAIDIKEGSLLKLHFLASKYTVRFQQGVYKSLHVTVLDKYNWLLRDSEHINRILDNYMADVLPYLSPGP